MEELNHPPDKRTWPRSMRRTMEGSIVWMGMGKAVQEAGRKTRRGTRVGDVLAF